MLNLTLLLLLTLFSCDDKEESRTPPPAETTQISPTPKACAFGERAEDTKTPPYVDTEAICAKRTKLRPMEASMLPIITKRYNARLAQHGIDIYIERCLSFRDIFTQVESLTLLPAALIAGFAMSESGGCKQSARGSNGDISIMQIFASSAKHRRTTAKLLDIKVDNLDYSENPLHNILLGAVILADYENRASSRFHGILSYNTGPTGMRRIARKIKRGTLPPLIAMRAKAPTTTIKHYVERVIADATIMMAALEGTLIQPHDALSPTQIPGWNPADDCN